MGRRPRMQLGARWEAPPQVARWEAPPQVARWEAPLQVARWEAAEEHQAWRAKAVLALRGPRRATAEPAARQAPIQAEVEGPLARRSTAEWTPVLPAE
ncbi:MAG: hypothetical protein ABI560_18980 [Myxococcales bacterium]